MKPLFDAQPAGTGSGGLHRRQFLHAQLRAGAARPTAGRSGERTGRFGAHVDAIAIDAALARARSHRSRILCLLRYLAEIDEVTAEEPDRSVIPELAHLFLDIAEAAGDGAAALETVVEPDRTRYRA